jgi:hypothetical protein
MCKGVQPVGRILSSCRECNLDVCLVCFASYVTGFWEKREGVALATHVSGNDPQHKLVEYQTPRPNVRRRDVRMGGGVD